MASPVDTSVKFFSSAMVGAPILRGQAGSLIAVLDACLVNGFGAQTASSLTVTAGVATLTLPVTPGLPEHAVVFIAGSSVAALNGEQKLTVVSANVLKFATAAADGVASGPITFKVMSAGWEKRFTGTNLAVYRSLDVSTTRFNLRVNDAAGDAARVVGYETMTTVSAGTAPFPTNTQQASGLFWTKAYTAGAEAVPWFVASNGKRFVVGAAWGSVSTFGGPTYTTMSLNGFGDFTSWKPAVDSFPCAIMGAPAVGDMSASFGQLQVSTGYFFARDHLGAAGASQATLMSGFNAASGASGESSQWGEFPTALAGSLLLGQPTIGLYPISSGVRGAVPEIFQTPQGILQSANIRTYDVIAGPGAYSGRKLLVISSSSTQMDPLTAAYHPAMFVDITGPWV